MMTALALLCLLPLLSSCRNAPAPQAAQLLHHPVPASLTQPTPAPQLAPRATWGNLATWGDEMIDALDSCNADKSAIRKLETQRAQRGFEHAEN